MTTRPRLVNNETRKLSGATQARSRGVGERSGEWEWQAEAAAARTIAVIALGVEWIPTTRRSFSTGASRFGGADAGNAEADRKLPGFPIRCGSQDSHLAQGVENRQSPIFSDMSFLLTLLLSLRPVQAPRSELPPILSADSVRALVAARVGHPRVPGIVVGRIAGAEMLRLSEGEGISGSTLFEIGSITKAFTGVLLADMWSVAKSRSMTRWRSICRPAP